ncbi:hypothetical protein [Candidatus Poriferisodalis sp.]|uniref:hypothetical protein n=1 Tax=Candidatus Poriferisodalis sp. TaxID=3101277 RepID=UPI003B01BE96
MTSAGDSDGGGLRDRTAGRAADGRVRWVVIAVAVVAMLAVVLAAWMWMRDGGDRVAALPDAEAVWTQIASEVPVDPDRRYSDEELGLFGLVDRVIFDTPFYVRFRTAEDAGKADASRDEYISSVASGHERERLAFEREIEDAVHSAYSSLPSDLGAGGLLEAAFVDAMRECAADRGYPNINPMGASEEERAYYESEFGLSSESFYDLRLECAQRAASYPTLDSEVRDELLYRVRKHYLEAAHDYLGNYDIVEIPIEHDESVIHPLEESYIRYCLEWLAADRESCADQYRVELTEEQKAAPVPEREPVDETTPYPLVGQPCGFSPIPGDVIIDRDGRFCDKFENLEFRINHPDTKESRSYVGNFFYGGPRLLNCPDSWAIDGEGKCRYPHPEDAAKREAFLEAHPEVAEGPPLISSFYPGRD